ncbi:LysR family transcriptional regulator [Gordonia sp. ABSL1-1]|uniref:LysR family transcriptional regulator n=1 Tax=Gordonia sp. ABSL1-1 TaxID=3053923 RepID=UPI0025745397|nr:LysR family transcriptional regulator [Gordonia sp. ABSL1-1]MDL9935792.1 LysR family transcriptional regulator [Gordonia sp. ABSL1-1]
MPRTFDITPLRSLVAVATTGGVHRAAQSLSLTQSAVSQHLRKLEREAGTALVTRDGRRIAFTPGGEELLAHARAILAAHDAAVHRFDKDSASVVTIGAAQNCAGVVLPTLMAELRATLSDREVRFRLDRNATVRQMVDARDVDVAVTTRVAPELMARTDGFRLDWLWSAAIDPPAPDDDIPLVVFTPPCTLRQPSFDSHSSVGRSWHVAAEINDLATGLDAVRGGVGTMLVPVLDRVPDGLIRLPGAPQPPAVQLVVAYADHTDPLVRETIVASLGDRVGTDRVESLPNHAFAMP